MIGILATGAYIPLLRLQRSAIFDAVGWFNGGLKGLANGERAMSRWDEDVITMAVEAGRDCLPEAARKPVRGVMLASTTHPFLDRQNAGVVKEALNLSDDVETLDIGGSQRAGVSALLQALNAVAAGRGNTLCVASEKRKGQPGSELEMISADAAAALLVGRGKNLAAEFLAAHTVSVDFVDHFRADGQDFDYGGEQRWVREEGYGKTVPRTVLAALAKAHLIAEQVDVFVMAAPMKGVNTAVAKACGIPPAAVLDPLMSALGDAGVAQPLLLLAHALETTAPGKIVVVAGFGQGCDVAIFRTTDRIASVCAGLGVRGWLARRKPESNYIKHLFFNGLVPLERGMRAEFDQKTPLTAAYRNRKAYLALVGGRCSKTGTVQFPKSDVSVAQNDRAVGTQTDYPLAERRARIVTHTADSLTYSPDPPVFYGAIDFDEGGRMTVEFTDVEPRDVFVDAPMRMMFRIKARDELRGYVRYFWKAAPDYRAPSDND